MNKDGFITVIPKRPVKFYTKAGYAELRAIFKDIKVTNVLVYQRTGKSLFIHRAIFDLYENGRIGLEKAINEGYKPKLREKIIFRLKQIPILLPILLTLILAPIILLIALISRKPLFSLLFKYLLDQSNKLQAKYIFKPDKRI